MSVAFKARILVAEDEEFTLNLLREVLTAANFQVEAVTNVADAIAAGANYVVIGRPITQSWAKGAQAMKERAQEIGSLLI